MSVTVPTALFDRAPDGTPYSPEFQDVYHSSHGGLPQARHVFLGGNELPARWRGRDPFRALESGVGPGWELLPAWDACRRDPPRPRRRHPRSAASPPRPRGHPRPPPAPL